MSNREPTIIKGRPPTLSDGCRILVARLTSIGDCIMASAVVWALRHRFPRCHLVWVVQDRCREVVVDHPCVDRVVVYERGNSPARAFLKTAAELRREACDVALDLHGILKASVLARLSRARTCVTLSTSRKASRALAHVVVHPDLESDPHRHTVDRYADLLRALGIQNPDMRMTVPVSEADRDRAESLFRESDLDAATPVLGLIVGASRALRLWPVESFAEIARWWWNEFHSPPLLIGGPGEKDLARAVQDASGRVCADFAGATSLRETAALLERCDLVVSGDTGPMHIAVAVGTPVVAIMRRDANLRNRPYGPGHIVLTPPSQAAQEESNLGAVTPDEVKRAVSSLLAARPGDTG